MASKGSVYPVEDDIREEIYSLHVGQETHMEGSGDRWYSFKDFLLVTYFLQLDSASSSFHNFPKQHPDAGKKTLKSWACRGC